MNTKEQKKTYKGPFDGWEFKARIFKLNKKGAKLSSKWIQTRSTAKTPLHYWDKELNKTKVLRYADNFDTPFADEQDGTAILRPIRFKHGSLHTGREQVGLQRFLMLHPKFGNEWTLVDKEKEAVDELVILDLEWESMKIARESDVELIESILRYNLKGGVDNMTTAELRKDAQLFAKKQPKLFLELANDEDLILRNLAIKSVDTGYLTISNDGNTVIHGKTGKKVLDVGFDDNPFTKLSQFFKTPEGIDLMKSLQSKFKQ